MSSCSTPKSVIVPKTHEVVIHQRDTILRTDSFIDRQKTVVQIADSAMMAKFGIKLDKLQKAWIIKESQIQSRKSSGNTIQYRDSIIRDSIPKPYPYPVIKELTKKQKFYMAMGKWFLVMIILVIAYTGIRLYKSYKK
jgi:hypothetical protein